MSPLRRCLALCCVLGAVSPSWGFTLVEDGRAKATIVFPAEPTRSAQTGVQDFQRTVKRITGAHIPAYPDTRQVKGPVILIGPSKGLAERGVDASALPYDNCLIRSGPDFLAIVGRDVDAPKGGSFYRETLMGTANGVYKFLEDFCGVRICMPGKNGTVAPPAKTLTVPDNIDVRFEKAILSGNPGFKGAGDAVLLRWQWRGMPGIKIKSHGGHGWTDWVIKPETYAKEHPEYYPLIDGRRRPDLGIRTKPTGEKIVNAGLCTTHADVRRITLDYLK